MSGCQLSWLPADDGAVAGGLSQVRLAIRRPTGPWGGLNCPESRRDAAAPPVLDPNDSTSQCVSRGCCTANFDPANVGLGSRLCENSDVQLACRNSFSILSM